MNLVTAVCPNFPKDRVVKESSDCMVWYKIHLSQKMMYVPTIKVLRSNPMELDRYIEAVNAFALVDFNDCNEFNWNPEFLNLYAYQYEECLTGLRHINQLIDVMPYDDRVVACDIETRRVEWEDNYLISIGFSTDDSTCVALYNIPIKGSQGVKLGVFQNIWEALQRLFARKDVGFTWHNGKFDCGRLKYFCNLDARIDEDTMLLHYVGINEKKGTHGLKDLGQLYLQAPAWDDELDNIKRDYCKKNKVLLKSFTYDLIPVEVLIPYMQRDCIATRRLLKKFKTMQRPGSEFIYSKLIEASNAYMRVELSGFYIDMDYLEDLEYNLEKTLIAATKKLDIVSTHVWDPAQYSRDTGAKIKLNEEFNPKSPKQLKWMLETLVGYKIAGTDAATIDMLVEEAEHGRVTNALAKEFLEDIAAVRKTSKYLDTFVQGTREGLCRDCRVRGTFNLHGTETGRLSSTNPNMQNIPRNKLIKNLYSAAPGKVLVQMDYSQAELRVLAMLSGDPSMIKVYQDDKDLHDDVARDIFGDGFTKEDRNKAKTVNFGIAFGRGPSSLVEAFGMPLMEARNIIDKWFKSKPLVKTWIDNRRRMARNGEPCITILGRERHFVVTDNDMYHIENEYINTPVQSTASDFAMFSLIEIDKYIRDHHYEDKVKIVSTVHDSIILECDEELSLVSEMGSVCKNIMATVPLKYVPDCSVPFKADVEVGYRWGEMYKFWEVA